MDVSLDGVHAVITGSSSGLGFAMAQALLEKGATVALASRPGEKLHNAVDSLVQEGLNAYALPMDVRSEESIGRAASWVRMKWKKIDLLVNNAAVMMHRIYPDFLNSPKPFYDIPPNVFRDVVDTNFIGYFLVTREFVPMMIERGKGRIVNISTSLSTMNMFAPYGPSRAGSEALSNIMTDELKKFGIMVNVLLPGGAVDTGEISIKMDQSLPFKLLSPDIMADPIIFLASHLADGITGERIIAKDFHEWFKEKVRS
ncbi:SDR family NAD(P)-dependent oxidoreductase [Thermodesulfobacteriota bacterium]